MEIQALQKYRRSISSSIDLYIPSKATGSRNTIEKEKKNSLLEKLQIKIFRAMAKRAINKGIGVSIAADRKS
jgi:hypothetical protein